MWLLFFFACNPVESCDKPGTDCCENAEQCEAFYGEAFPLCGPRGLCVECLLDPDCPGMQTCEPDAVIGSLCLEI